ncbi:serine-protein kinase RsbW [Clostridioides difficile]|nr:serine-protein kinase RsbW [Clostridioides difficile]
MDVSSISTPDLENPKESGLGLFIIKTLMDDVDIESEHNQGTKIKMTKYLGVDI